MTVTTALDPTFGMRGVVFGSASPSDTNLSSATAVAVQADGKIVEVGSVGTGNSTQNPGLAARRYNADGSVDTTFGTNGQVNIPEPSTLGQFSSEPRNVVVESNGDIVFAAVAAAGHVGGPPNYIPPFNSVVVRLTPTGQFDSTFGTNGQYVNQSTGGYLASVAVQSDGKVVVAGFNNTSMTISIIRLTAAGVLDPTFNSTGQASVALPTPGLGGTVPEPSFAALLVTPTGQVLVSGSVFTLLGHEYLYSPVLAELQADGTLNSSFGTAGFASLNSSEVSTISALAVQPDGAIVVAGNHEFVSPNELIVPATALDRLTPTGAVDPTFASIIAPNSGGESVSSVALGTDGIIAVGGNKTIGTSSYPFVARYLASGAVDASFGVGGRALLSFRPTFSAGSPTTPQFSLNSVALTATGDILAAGQIYNYYRDPATGQSEADQGNQAFLAQVLPVKTSAVANDYDGDGKSDLAGVLGAFAVFAYRPSSGAADVLAPFGPPVVGAAIPAPGDYDGDGKTDIAAYFPAYGALVYRPSSGGADVVVPIGIPGAGRSIPAPGDYDGDGKTDPAVYLPAFGALAYRPSSGGADVVIPFGIAGAGQSIPAPGDYDGDGKTDPAVYLENLGILAYRPSSGGPDVLEQFGIAGQSIPAPGDYDGDGRTDIAAYLPKLGIYAYRPSWGGPDVLEQFGIAGAGQSIPAPGDYNGDGRTDIAVYLPSIAYFAYRPSGGGADVLAQFGAAGTEQTVPAASIPASFSVSSAGTVAATAVGGSVAIHDLALTDDLISPELVQLRRKPRAAS